MATNAIRTEVSKGPVTFDSFRVSSFQRAGTKTAILRQEVKTVSHYPSIQVENDKQDNLFSLDEFGAEEQSFTTVEHRVAFMDVPENITEEQMQEKLRQANANGACLYKVLSNYPILTDNHKNAIARGLTDLDTIAKSQVVRYPAGSDNEGEIIPDPAGKIQYRKVFFSKTAKADEDYRGNGNEYVPEDIEREFAGGVTANADQEVPI